MRASIAAAAIPAISAIALKAEGRAVFRKARRRISRPLWPNWPRWGLTSPPNLFKVILLGLGRLLEGGPGFSQGQAKPEADPRSELPGLRTARPLTPSDPEGSSGPRYRRVGDTGRFQSGIFRLGILKADWFFVKARAPFL